MYVMPQKLLHYWIKTYTYIHMYIVATFRAPTYIVQLIKDFMAKRF